MPWDWLGEKAVHPPEGWTVAFLGPKHTPPYILRKRAPSGWEDEPPEDWIEEPLEWIERPPRIEERREPRPEGSTEMTRTQIRRAHRKAKLAAGKEAESGRKGRETTLGAPECDEGAKAIETERRVSENPPPRGRRKALAAEGQYGVEDSAFARMIEAKKKAAEAPPPRGRKKGRIKQIENAPYLAKETVSEQARAKMIEARRRVEEVPPPRGRRR
jgi:hypothetical protein